MELFETMSQNTQRESQESREEEREVQREENAVTECGPLTLDPQNCDP